MIKLTYTLQEMTEALERIGYTVRLEKETETILHYHREEEVERNVYNLYRMNQLVTDEMFKYMFGTKRLEWVFERELQKRVLKLF